MYNLVIQHFHQMCVFKISAHLLHKKSWEEDKSRCRDTGGAMVAFRAREGAEGGVDSRQGSKYWGSRNDDLRDRLDAMAQETSCQWLE